MTLEPILLTDKTRLQEIYDLRVDVWENSEKSEFVNRQLFPNGWFDDLDQTAFHWVITNDQDKIIAAARLNIFDSFEKSPYSSNLKHLELPRTSPVGFMSRLVINQEYQKLGLSKLFVKCLIQFCEIKKVSWIKAFTNNQLIENLLFKLNFKFIDEVEINYIGFRDSHNINLLIKKMNLTS